MILSLKANLWYNEIMKLELAYLGNPVLRKKGEPISRITPEVRQLVDDMVETLETSGNGIGLSAPQVKALFRLFIIKVPYRDDKGKEHDGELKVFINPTIISYSEEEWEQDEGCLSIPGVYAPVCRPEKIVVEALDLDGNLFTAEYSGLEGRCILHENDHINGVLFIDRVKGRARKKIESDLERVKKKYA